MTSPREPTGGRVHCGSFIGKFPHAVGCPCIAAFPDAESVKDGMRMLVIKWREEANKHIRWSYPEADAANKERQDTLDRCADELEAALAPTKDATT